MSVPPVYNDGGDIGEVDYSYSLDGKNGYNSRNVTSASQCTNLPSNFSITIPFYTGGKGNRRGTDGGHGGGAGGGAGASANGSNGGERLGNEGGGGGSGYTWIDSIEYVRGGPGGSTYGRDAYGNPALDHYGCGGAGGSISNKNQGYVTGSQGQPGMFAIAWK